MTKIRTSNKALQTLPKKFARLVTTNDPFGTHRVVETKDDALEFRVGTGKRNEMSHRAFITFIRGVIQDAKRSRIEYLAIPFGKEGIPVPKKYDEAWAASSLIENLHLAAYEFTKYKTTEKKEYELKEICVCYDADTKCADAFLRGEVVGASVNLTRDIVNTTAEHMTPTALGNAARDAVKNTNVKVTVLGEKELIKLKMGALLAVGQGTRNESKLILLEYWGAGKSTESSAKGKANESKRPIVLIGKGITYDTGGLNVKPSGSMHDMHMDMSGGSSVIGAVTAAAKLKLKKNIIGIIPAAENAISDSSMRAGDIVTSMSGKTIEVVHTDAEGRMVLADALTYAERYNPRVIIDAATLTGAALVALGQHASAVMTKDESLERTLRDLGEESGDYVWPLPLWDEYKQYLKSYRADIANIAPNFSRFGGAIEGGTFLSHFVPKDVPWAHIDIAPRMDAISADKLAKGSTGEPTRLLIKFTETY